VGCLSETAVLELLHGRLAARSAPEAEEHLAACADCRRLVSELARGVDATAETHSSGPHSSGPDSTEETALSAGAVIAGRFRLERLLGRGGMGEVWAALHLVTRRQVALKLVRASTEERRSQRVEREARAAGAVHHPGIVPVADVLELDDGTPVLVMDLLHGRSLGARLAEGGALPLDEAVRVLRPVAEAVRAAHAQGVIHRDLKPDNVFLCDDGAVKVLDFGVAKVVSPDEGERLDLTRTGELIGTPHYMAPEQAFGETGLDGRTDVWGLGVTLYECLAGRRPFQGDSLGALLRAVATGRVEPIASRVPSLPTQAARLVDRMMSVERERRPSMDEVIATLDALAAGRPRRSSGRAIAIAAAALIAIAAAAFGVWRVARGSASATAHVAPPAIAPAHAVEESPPARPVEESPREESPAPKHHPTATAATPASGTSHVKPAEAPATPTPERLPGGVIEKVPF
jgi:serine/threonine-protein kinase